MQGPPGFKKKNRVLVHGNLDAGTPGIKKKTEWPTQCKTMALGTSQTDKESRHRHGNSWPRSFPNGFGQGAFTIKKNRYPKGSLGKGK